MTIHHIHMLQTCGGDWLITPLKSSDMKGNCYVCTLLPHSSHSTRLEVKVPKLEYHVECVLSAITLLLDVQKWHSPMQCFNPNIEQRI